MALVGAGETKGVPAGAGVGDGKAAPVISRGSGKAQRSFHVCRRADLPGQIDPGGLKLHRHRRVDGAEVDGGPTGECAVQILAGEAEIAETEGLLLHARFTRQRHARHFLVISPCPGEGECPRRLFRLSGRLKAGMQNEALQAADRLLRIEGQVGHEGRAVHAHVDRSLHLQRRHGGANPRQDEMTALPSCGAGKFMNNDGRIASLSVFEAVQAQARHLQRDEM
jgi:hypothetical protein